MTEDEAKTKWCPMVRAESATRHLVDGSVEANCIGSACMMWRTPAIKLNGLTMSEIDDLQNISADNGYCGLAGP